MSEQGRGARGGFRYQKAETTLVAKVPLLEAR